LQQRLDEELLKANMKVVKVRISCPLKISVAAIRGRHTSVYQLEEELAKLRMPAKVN
jgi:hypothetical protein